MRLLKKLYNKIKDINPEHIEHAITYLIKYGYLGNTENIEDFYKALIKFQTFCGLFSDGELGHGELDPITVEKMYQPRCAVGDNLIGEEYRWNKKNLTYYLHSSVGDAISNDRYAELVDLAFKNWEDVADLKINRTNHQGADIIVGTGRGRRDGFDGSSGTLAWSYLPNGNTQVLMKMDLDEYWVENLAGNRGILALNVLCHEFGHSLGLTHSSRQNALMAPYYNPAISKPQQNDDVTRMQAIYGKPQAIPPNDPPPNDPPPSDEITLTIKGNISEIKASSGWRISKIS